MERSEMERCLEQVAAYRASGQKAKVWAEANGVPLQMLASWCAHAGRWQARLDGVVPVPAEPKRSGFLAAHVAPAGTVRIELHVGTTRVELHWPLVHTRELATWLHEVGR